MESRNNRRLIQHIKNFNLKTFRYADNILPEIRERILEEEDSEKVIEKVLFMGKKSVGEQVEIADYFGLL